MGSAELSFNGNNDKSNFPLSEDSNTIKLTSCCDEPHLTSSFDRYGIIRTSI